MKAYLVKYFETKGIQEIEGDIRQKEYFSSPNSGWHVINRDVFFEKHKAIEKAEAMRVKKIASLKKQIEKLEKLKFEL